MMHHRLAERAKCNGLLSKLTNSFLLAELAMIRNALRSQQELCLYLQKKSASAIDAVFRVETVVKTFLTYKNQSGHIMRKFLDSVELRKQKSSREQPLVSQQRNSCQILALHANIFTSRCMAI